MFGFGLGGILDWWGGYRFGCLLWGIGLIVVGGV